MNMNELHSLEEKIEALIHQCHRLAAENQALRESQASLISERATLQEKNNLARTRIEAMIARLKAMEVGT
jgi:cell division protein ZapB